MMIAPKRFVKRLLRRPRKQELERRYVLMMGPYHQAPCSQSDLLRKYIHLNLQYGKDMMKPELQL